MLAASNGRISQGQPYGNFIYLWWPWRIEKGMRRSRGLFQLDDNDDGDLPLREGRLRR